MMENGVQCVRVDGLKKKLRSHADSWDFHPMVKDFYSLLTIARFNVLMYASFKVRYQLLMTFTPLEVGTQWEETSNALELSSSSTNACSLTQ